MKKLSLTIALIIVFSAFQGCADNGGAKKIENIGFDFKEKAQIIHSNITNKFYDKLSNLYYETNLGMNGKDEKRYCYLWPLAALFQAYAQEFIAEGSKDRTQIDSVMKSIERYFNVERAQYTKGLGYDSYVVDMGGGQRYYDDNQWLGLTYCDLYESTKDPALLEKAKAIYKFSWSGFDTKTGGGIYWREGDFASKNTCSNGPQIVLALRLKMLDQKDDGYVKKATELYNWVNKKLKSPENIYWDKINVSDGAVDKTAWAYNTGTMLQSNVLFYEITKDEKYLKEAQAIAKSSLSYFAPKGQFPENIWFNAVLLRGYKELFKIDGDPQYINAFQKYVKTVWETQRTGVDQLIGVKEPKTLIDQAGMLEICSSLYN
ncbi:MAG: glycoside hydrolase family 76 protein [Clostridia bacterium]